ncbi:hypothetical protein RI129_011202 [Pyrocoelia pectoralis]|uniref:Uncharacterized protein n=1 Tax=Pyrocoelia pectoralis TaxID=417401 RepID=A0AAN7V7L6_9COLE
MTFLVATTIICTIFFVGGGDACGYYWREFDGIIPPDALPAGLDVYNKPIYIGQALYENLLIPAKIYHNDNTAYFEYGGKELTTKLNVKILCTDEPDQFEWIKTNNSHIREITDRFLVQGGYHPSSSTYIGRIRTDGEVLIGKVLADNTASEGLHVTQKGTARSFSSFEVLSYQAKKVENKPEAKDTVPEVRYTAVFT